MLLNTLHISFWAKTSIPVGISATIVDASERYEWVAFWQTFNLTQSWQRFEATTALDSSGRLNHQLQAGLVLGGHVATYHFDQLVIDQSCSNWPEPWAPSPARDSLDSGFEDCTSALPQLQVSEAAAHAIHAELYSPAGARTGRLGARLKVSVCTLDAFPC